jgi:hypothetical protein
VTMGRSASNITKLVLQHYNLDARAVPVQLRIAGGEALGALVTL